MGRITLPFRTQFQQMLHTLKKTYLAALRDIERRQAFNQLISAWSSELGAMSYAEVPYILDVMLLTAVVDNRRLIIELYEKLNVFNTKLGKIQTHLEKLSSTS